MLGTMNKVLGPGISWPFFMMVTDFVGSPGPRPGWFVMVSAALVMMGGCCLATTVLGGWRLASRFRGIMEGGCPR